MSGTLHGYQDPDLPQLSKQVIDEINYQAAKELAQRSIIGAVIVLLALIISAYASPIVQDAPLLTYSLIGAMTIVAMLRLYLVHLIIKNVNLTDKIRLILIGVFLFGAFVWGLYMGISWYWYGPASFNLIILMFTIGIGAGAATALFIWLQLSQLYLLFIFTPILIVTLMHWHGAATSIIFGLCAYFVFLLDQAKRTHAEYWRSLCMTKTLQMQKEALESANKLVKQSSQAKSAFLSSMSHELRTPLNAIQGFAQLIQSDEKTPPTPQQNECLDHIQKASKHLLTLINQVLDLAKIEAGKLEVELGAIDLPPLVDECVMMIRAQAREQHIELKVGSVYPGLRVVADSTHLKQVLLNLLNNAVKYNQPGGEVRLTFHLEPKHILIKVSDTGIGISEKNQKELFKSFTRLGQEKTATQGSGVGLVITKSLLETMRSKLEFSSVENKGSSFWFRLPLAN